MAMANMNLIGVCDKVTACISVGGGGGDGGGSGGDGGGATKNIIPTKFSNIGDIIMHHHW